MKALQIRKKVGNGERKLHNELIMDVQKSCKLIIITSMKALQTKKWEWRKKAP
jgi:hypothetical protein